MTTATPPVLIAILGMALIGLLTGAWWILVGYVVYMGIIFGVLEIRFLCSHCPYYVREGKILHCLGNNGAIKLWKYHPEPMNRLERFMMYFLIFTVYFLLPLLAMGYGMWSLYVDMAQYGQSLLRFPLLLGMSIITVATLLSSLAFVIVLKTFFCSRCVNFSCPLNSVPKPVVDEYLSKNQVMREAWERAGYELG